MVVNRSKTGYWNLIAVEYHDDGSGPENIPIIDKPQERVNKNCYKLPNRNMRGIKWPRRNHYQEWKICHSVGRGGWIYDSGPSWILPSWLFGWSQGASKRRITTQGEYIAAWFMRRSFLSREGFNRWSSWWRMDFQYWRWGDGFTKKTPIEMLDHLEKRGGGGGLKLC